MRMGGEGWVLWSLIDVQLLEMQLLSHGVKWCEMEAMGNDI